MIALIAGAIVNLLLAWFMLWFQEGPHNPVLGASSQVLWNRYARPNTQHGAAAVERASGALGCDFFILEADPPGPTPSAPPRMMITRAGLPFRAFEGMHSWGNVKPGYCWSIPVRPFNTNVSWVSALPFRPMPGCLVNTLLFAGVIWIVIFGPVRAIVRTQRRWRIAQKRCPDCGYDLVDSFERGCPECGWRRKASSSSPPREF